MRNLYVVSGRLTEVHRFINVPMGWFEQHPARERRELWIETPEGQELKLVVHSQMMPARQGHAVEAILCESNLVGLANATTGSRVNYARADPPLVWRRSESLALTMGLLGSFFMAVMMEWVLLSGALALCLLLGLSGAMLKRLASNARLKMRVDTALDKLSGFQSPRTLLRRVK